MKFTKGKDLSSRSEQDLDCIFGKRKSKSESNTPLTQSAVSISEMLCNLNQIGCK